MPEEPTPRRNEGRDLEVLVAMLERVLHGAPLEVESPALVRGRRSGEIREIDVAIRGRIGTSQVFVMVECRDRSRTQGVEWIDGVKGKADDVGASKVVVVSSSSFSRGARALAASAGVELRELPELGPDHVMQWIAPEVRTVAVIRRHVHVHHTTVDFPGAEGVEGELQSTPLLRKKVDHSLVEVTDLWRSADTAEVYDGLEIEERREVRLNIRFENPRDRFQVKLGTEWFDIHTAGIRAEVWIEREDLSLRRFRYSDGGESLAEGLQFEIESDGQPMALALIRQELPDGSGRLSMAARPYRGIDAEEESDIGP